MSADPDPNRRGAAQRANDLLRGVWGSDPKIRDSVYATTRNLMRAWIDPAVGDACNACEIDLEWLCSGNNTLYICAPLSIRTVSLPCSADASPTSSTRPTTGTCAPTSCSTPRCYSSSTKPATPRCTNLPKWASTIAGLGIRLVTVWQSKAQIDEMYGRHADTILTNHLTKLFYAGTSDHSTVEFASRLLGDEFVAALLDEDRGGHRHGDRGRSVTPVRLGPPHMFRQMDPGTAVLVHGTLPPAHVRTLAPARRGRRMAA